MNTIEEILKNKQKEICHTCANRKSKENVCNITLNLRNEAQCINYERCMKNKCKTCKNSEKCNDKDYTKNRKTTREDRLQRNIHRDKNRKDKYIIEKTQKRNKIGF